MLILLGMILVLTTGNLAAKEFNPAGWELPVMYGAEKYADDRIDFDPNIPGNETRLEKFRTLEGGRIFRYSHNNLVFSYKVDINADDPMDYELVDYNGSGLFEIKQSPYDEYPMPTWTYR